MEKKNEKDDVKKLQASVAGLKGAITCKNKEIDWLKKKCVSLEEKLAFAIKYNTETRYAVAEYNELPWYKRIFRIVVLPD